MQVSLHKSASFSRFDYLGNGIHAGTQVKSNDLHPISPKLDEIGSSATSGVEPNLILSIKDDGGNKFLVLIRILFPIPA